MILIFVAFFFLSFIVRWKRDNPFGWTFEKVFGAYIYIYMCIRLTSRQQWLIILIISGRRSGWKILRNNFRWQLWYIWDQRFSRLFLLASKFIHTVFMREYLVDDSFKFLFIHLNTLMQFYSIYGNYVMLHLLTTLLFAAFERILCQRHRCKLFRCITFAMENIGL